MPESFLSLFPKVEDVLSLDVEELGGVVFEIMPPLLQSEIVHVRALSGSAFPPVGPGYPQNYYTQFENAVAEAISWLETQGLIVQDPGQAAGYFRLTRRGRKITGRAGVAAFKASHVLPADLLHPSLARVRPQFLRGEYDVAVFQAFKIVEVQVRNAANAKGGGYPDDLLGVSLMRKAFHSDNGPLTDKELVSGERDAMSSLFAGAMGHAKNPTGHREVALKPEAAARLIILAAHLLDVVDERAKP